MSALQLDVHEVQTDEIAGVVNLFCEAGTNPYNWSIARWQHNYYDYPEGHPVSLVAVVGGRIVGHYGMLPIQIGKYKAMLGQHAYVAKGERGLTIISALMQAADYKCRDLKVALICGFANERFSFIKSTIFQWQTVCWLGFQKGISINDILTAQSKPFKFQYSTNWFRWRFGTEQEQYLSRYIDNNGNLHKQILKATTETSISLIQDAEGWSPCSTYANSSDSQFRQPFSVKIFDRKLIDLGVLDFNNWSIEMGDSDTFNYVPW